MSASKRENAVFTGHLQALADRLTCARNTKYGRSKGMEITSELKAKLIKAGSEEEVKALLGDRASEEESARIWKEIEAHRPTDNLETVDDDELEVVSGGFFYEERDYINDGCADHTRTGDFFPCWRTDSCDMFFIQYTNCNPCPKGGNHESVIRIIDGAEYYVCPKCGQKTRK